MSVTERTEKIAALRNIVFLLQEAERLSILPAEQVALLRKYEELLRKYEELLKRLRVV